MLNVYTDADDWSWAPVQITPTADGGLGAGDDQFIPFSSFQQGSGLGADFTRVGAIQMSINGVNAIDGQVGPIQTVGPKVLAANFVDTAQADLAVVKSAVPNPVVPGSQLTYTFVTTNNGPSNATGVTLADTLPASVQYVSSSGQGTVTNNNGNLSVQIGGLAAGASATTSIVVAVNPFAYNTITNTVTVTGNQPDPNPTNNTSTVVTQVVPAADLALAKTVQPNPATAGQQVTYTLITTNYGPNNATGVTIVDTLPGGLSYASANGVQPASVAGQMVTFIVGNLVVGASDTITFAANVALTVAGALTNTAVVHGDQPDPNPANNTATATTTVTAPPIPQSYPDLSIVKTAAPNPVDVGGSLTYTLVVTNDSFTTATGVTVIDTLPAGFNYYWATGQNTFDALGHHAHLGPGHRGAAYVGHDHDRRCRRGERRQHDHQHGHGLQRSA